MLFYKQILLHLEFLYSHNYHLTLTIYTFFSAIYLNFEKSENINCLFFSKNRIFASKIEYRYMKKKSWFLFGVIWYQIFFFTFFVWYFYSHSFLRPSATIPIELFLAMMLTVVMLVNFWFLYPVLRVQKRTFYYTLCLLMVTMAVLVEYFLTKECTFSIYPTSFLTEEGGSIRKSFIFNLFLRDGALVVFSGLMAEILGLKTSLEEKDKIILLDDRIHAYSSNGKISTYVEIRNLCYVKQKENYNILVTTDGQKYNRRGTLKSIESLLEGKDFVKISKSILVHLTKIESKNGNVLTFSALKDADIMPVNITSSYAETAIPVIERYLYTKGLSGTEVNQQEKLTEQVIITMQSEEPSAKVTTHLEVNTTRTSKGDDIYNYIINHNNCKLNDIVSETNIPKSTVTRYLKEMLEENRIEYVGSKKTGGYRAVAQQKQMNHLDQNSLLLEE